MSEPPIEDPSVAAVDVRSLVRSNAPAAVILNRLRDVIPFQSAILTAWDEAGTRHRRIAGGLPLRATNYLLCHAHEDPLFSTARRSGQGAWFSDLEIRQRNACSTAVAISEQHPFGNGLMQPLLARDGTYVGLLSLFVGSNAHVHPARRNLITLLLDDLASLARPPALEVLSPGDTDTRSITARERAVLGLIGRGLTNRRIAEEFRIAPRTVATHVEHILDKLDVPNRAAAVAFASTHGFLDDDRSDARFSGGRTG